MEVILPRSRPPPHRVSLRTRTEDASLDGGRADVESSTLDMEERAGEQAQLVRVLVVRQCHVKRSRAAPLESESVRYGT